MTKIGLYPTRGVVLDATPKGKYVNLYVAIGEYKVNVALFGSAKLVELERGFKIVLFDWKMTYDEEYGQSFVCNELYKIK